MSAFKRVLPLLILALLGLKTPVSAAALKSDITSSLSCLSPDLEFSSSNSEKFPAENSSSFKINHSVKHLRESLSKKLKDANTAQVFTFYYSFFSAPIQLTPKRLSIVVWKCYSLPIIYQIRHILI